MGLGGINLIQKLAKQRWHTFLLINATENGMITHNGAF